MRSILNFGFVLLIILVSSVPGLAEPNFSCTEVIDVPQAECEALVALYNSTNGPGWSQSTNWLASNVVSEWYGVSIESGHVTELNLSWNNLSGNIPIELGHLTDLNVLNLYNNQLSGNIPAELGNLTNLTRLNLGWNYQLSGSIPPELGNLTSLSYLELGFNQLSGSIPAELGQLTNLTFLGLYYNQLSGSIPPELGNLTNLTYFDVGSNQISGSIPAEMGNLTNLGGLYLYSNQLSGSIPVEMGNLTNLQVVWLVDNQLSGSIPAELGNLINLHKLDLSRNLLSGDVPDSFINLVSLYDAGGDGDGSDGLILDYNMLNIPDNYPDPSIPLHVFLSQKDPDWQFYQGFVQEIGTEGGEITSLDEQTTVIVPEDTLDGETTFTFLPQPAPESEPNNLTFAGNTFLLTAEDALGDPVTVFDPPLTVTITYTDADILGIPEDTLALYYWDTASSAWVDAVTTCPGGEYTRDLVGNTLSLPICHLSEFGLFGSPYQIFLPVMVKR